MGWTEPSTGSCVRLRHSTEAVPPGQDFYRIGPIVGLRVGHRALRMPVHADGFADSESCLG